jgi:hypothetical protein
MTTSSLSTAPIVATDLTSWRGFGLGTANMFRNMIGLPEAKWEDRGIEQEQEARPRDGYTEFDSRDRTTVI